MKKSPTTLIMEIRVNANPHLVWSILQDLVESGEVCEFHTLTVNGKIWDIVAHRPDLQDLAETIAGED